MLYKQYRFKFYLNAYHSIFLNGTKGERHPHTWEIIISVLKVRDEFVEFHVLESEVDKLLSKYEDQIINDIPPFDTVNPTLENLTYHLKDLILEKISNLGWRLLKLEVSETPARAFVIDLNQIDDKEILKQEADYLLKRMMENRGDTHE